MQPPTGRRREPPAGAARGAGRQQQPPPAGPPGRLFFMPAPAPPPPNRRPPPPPADRDRPFSVPPLAPPGRSPSHSPQPPPSDPHPPSPTTRPPPPPHAYGDYDPAESDHRRRPPHPHDTPLPPPHRLPRRSSPSPCSSCLVATAFLLLSSAIAGTALFLLFRPRPPDIAVAAVRLPSFSASNGTVAFTFEQTAAVRNPNRSPLAHFDSSLRVAYAGGELGAAVYIPAGLIGGGGTRRVSAVFDVPAIPVAGAAVDAASAVQQQSQAPVAIEVRSLLVVKGRVNVLRVLTHRVQAAKLCRVAVSPLDGTVLGFRC